ncbi:Endonuclease/exonuclease/phosphatase [Crassisporium funariophilum]|nr:Endonuclease/exonuclease/phosphatase [Crassisporium funariophilum]
MRVLTWNINGVRTLPQYHPWNTLKDFDDILEYLGADILCFQEMKTSRQNMPKSVAVPPSYDSFFSFPQRKTGYSGVATYTRRTTSVPRKAEEGLMGLIQPKPPFKLEERISDLRNYPPSSMSYEGEDEDDVDFKDLDSEGRAVVVDLGLFVLINVYCPNDGTGTGEREKYKMNYHRALEARVNGLIKEGREVMVVGDLNACAAVNDHCEGPLMVARGLAEGLQGEEGFWGKAYRRWIRDWLVDESGGGGCMVDIVRKLWPGRKGMYTCWNTKISARESNYGTRIDFILITPGLVPWVESADIQPHVKGSDHCPVYVDFRDEITDSHGNTVQLRDVLGVQAEANAVSEPPRLAAKFWDEYSGKQKLLVSFFGKKATETSLAATPIPASEFPRTMQNSHETESSPVAAPIDLTLSPSRPVTQISSRPLPSPPLSSGVEMGHLTLPTNSKRKLPTGGLEATSKKLKLVPSQKKETEKTKEKIAGQSKIANFFAQPKASSSQQSSSTSSATSSSRTKGKARATQMSSSLGEQKSAPHGRSQVDEEADYRFALQLSQSQSQDGIPSSSQSSFPEKEKEKKQAWSNLLAPIQPPKCSVHHETAKEFTVNKQGPNKGKRFFICSRPVGPGYDKGRAERLREQVDPQWRCDFFKWSSEVRREMMRGEDS